MWLTSVLTSRTFAADFFIRTWQSGDGLPQNAVTAIVQTRDSYLWIGTYSALVRFDGVRFKVFDNSTTPELQSSRVTSLYEAPDGALWIGHETGELTRFKDGKFTAQEYKTDWNARKIVAVTSDTTGDIWLANEEGQLARVRDGLVYTPRAGIATRLVSVARDEHGLIWILRNGKISAVENGKLYPVDLEGETPESFVHGICASRTGGFWVARDGQLRKWQDGRWVEDMGDCPWGTTHLLAMIETRSGAIAGGTIDSGLHLAIGPGRSLNFNHTNGLPQDWVRVLCEDHESNLWVGVGSAGMATLRAGRVANVNPPDRWQGRSVLSVGFDANDAMWVGSEGAGVYRFSGGEWKRFGENSGLENSFVWALSTDSQGRLWLGTWGGGVYWLRGETFARVPGLENFNVPSPSIFHGANGVAWIGTTEGLLRYEDGQTQWYGRREGLDQPDVRAFAESPDGTLWFGMIGGGLASLKDGKIHQFRKRDGLSSDSAQCLYLDKEGVLWVGTIGSGVNRFKQGRFDKISTSEGLVNNVICDIIEDDAGYFWISSHGGIMRVSRSDMVRCADGEIPSVKVIQYGLGEGLPTLECSGGLQSGGARSADGKLWFSTTKGLVSVDPKGVKKNQIRPPVLIEEMLVEEKPVALTGGPLHIPPGRQRFEIRYTALSFTVPEKVQFKYRLEGLEKDWVNAGRDRVAPYSHIPPGDYRFHVIACNNDGVWNESGATLDFLVLPQFWQTWWFRMVASLAATAVIAGTVWLVMRQRMRRKLERLEQQRAIERERARIAKDIHDDLGASLTRITMLSQSVRGELDAAPHAAGDVDRIYDTARDLTRALEEIVWAVNPRHDTLDSLATYLGKFAQDFLTAAHIRCRLDVPMQLPPWPLTAEVRHNLFLAFKEGLNNAVKHSGATEVRISLTIQPSGFALILEDSGRGFDFERDAGNHQPASSTVGNGLINMRQRLAEIHGSCEIQTSPGKGTILRFAVPIRQAVHRNNLTTG